MHSHLHDGLLVCGFLLAILASTILCHSTGREREEEYRFKQEDILDLAGHMPEAVARSEYSLITAKLSWYALYRDLCIGTVYTLYLMSVISFMTAWIIT